MALLGQRDVGAADLQQPRRVAEPLIVGPEWPAVRRFVVARLHAWMSACGTLRTLMPALSMSALGGEADIPNPSSDVR